MRVILAVAMILVCIDAHSQKLVPSPSINSQQEQLHTAKTDRKPTTEPSSVEEKPFVAKSLEAEKSHERLEQEGTEREEKSTTEKSLVLWTIVLAVATIALAIIASGQFWMFWRQLTLMREGADNAKVLAKAAQLSAEAAKIQADVLMNSERAYVKMSHVPPGVKIEEARGLFEVTVEVRNHGRTPANVTDVLLKVTLREHDEPLLKYPDYQVPHREGTPNGFLVAGDHFFHSRTFPLRGSNLSDAKSHAKKLWLYGYVDYIDTFKQRHRAGYARVYNPILDDGKQNNLVFVTEEQYNYDRLRKPGEGNDWS